MPLFAFVCTDCGREFEELVRAEESAPCPACDSRAVERQLARVHVASSRPAPPPGPGACGSCGDPRGPGACSLN